MRRTIPLLAVLLLPLLAACAAQKPQPLPLVSLSRQPDSFNLRVRNYQVTDSGWSNAVEYGVAELEVAAIRTLTDKGYAYRPAGDTPRYLVELHLVCSSPRSQALVAAGEVDTPQLYASPFFPGFEEVDRVMVWSPQVDAVRASEGYCQGQATLLVHDQTRPAPGNVFVGKTETGPCENLANCPFSVCLDALRRSVERMLREKM